MSLDWVFHLHGLKDNHGVTLGDFLALFDVDLDDGALHRSNHSVTGSGLLGTASALLLALLLGTSVAAAQSQVARQGYFDGTSFHRVLYGFVVQGGDAGGTGTGGASIWNNEPFAPEVSASLRHYPGALCAAKSPESERSILSQFYFVQALPQTLESELQAQLEAAGTPEAVLSAYNAAGGLPYLDYTDTVFGQVYQGMEVVDAIALVEVDENGKPAEDVLINSVTISSYTAS